MIQPEIFKTKDTCKSLVGGSPTVTVELHDPYTLEPYRSGLSMPIKLIFKYGSLSEPDPVRGS